MALNQARVHAALNAAVEDFDFIQIHTGDPGASGTSNVATAVADARIPITWSAAAGGQKTATVTFTVTGASAPLTHVSGWSADSSGTHQGNAQLTPAEGFAGAGSLQVTVTLTGTAT